MAKVKIELETSDLASVRDALILVVGLYQEKAGKKIKVVDLDKYDLTEKKK